MLGNVSLKKRQETLEKIATEIRTCEKCPLSKGRTLAVPGEGRLDAELMFVGEAPGFHEDRAGQPFVGASGRYLEELLGSIGLRRPDVFITNIVRCRPPQNRDPFSTEIEACQDYLFRQIEMIQPRVVATLGRFSMGLFFPGEKISHIHGQPKEEGGHLYYPLFHPAAVLRNPQMRPIMEADFLGLKALLDSFAPASEPPPPPGDEPPPPEKPVQLSLF